MARTFDFSGKVAVVTGVGRVGQIGHAVASGLGEAGARLVVCDRNAVAVAARAMEFSARGIEAQAAAGDLTEPDVASWVVEEATKAFGRVDVLVNVAGGLVGVGEMTEADADVLDREVAINVKTTYLVSRAVARVMISQKSGAIVNFASVAALHAKPGMAAYSAAKAGVAAITRSLALELRDHGVRVNAVAPGTVRTDDNVRATGEQPLRWVEKDEIVNAVLFLASDYASGITGHVLPVSKGEL